jgi:hypothetical protein
VEEVGVVLTNYYLDSLIFKLIKTIQDFKMQLFVNIKTLQDPISCHPASTGYFRTNLETGASNGTLFQVFTSKYIDANATTEYTSEQNWHVIRLADVYLMRAEAMAEINQNPATANDDINILRNRVGMTAFDGSGMSMSDFRTALLRERGVELFMEGHRFFDITRMGVYDEYCRTVLNNNIGARQPEDYTWPIPLIETTANDNIN